MDDWEKVRRHLMPETPGTAGETNQGIILLDARSKPCLFYTSPKTNEIPVIPAMD
jgi:hypothetical protein